MVGTWFIDKVWSPGVEWVSFEKLLTKTKRPNGGDMILLRTVCITAWLYVLAVILKQVWDPDRMWEFSRRELLIELKNTLPWGGAIFAGVYASLYARFSSQWLYLAGLYNQIKAIEARTASAPTEDTKNKIAEWKAGFIEDSNALHLSTKKIFVSVVKIWGDKDEIKREFIKNTLGGEDTYNELMKNVNETYNYHANRTKQRIQRSRQKTEIGTAVKDTSE